MLRSPTARKQPCRNESEPCKRHNGNIIGCSRRSKTMRVRRRQPGLECPDDPRAFACLRPRPIAKLIPGIARAILRLMNQNASLEALLGALGDGMVFGLRVKDSAV